MWPLSSLFLLLVAAAGTSRGSEPLTGGDSTAAVDEHNRWRRAEGANDMMEMEWDESYAASASVWAAKCQWSHKIEKEDTLKYAQTGQNMWYSTGSLDVPGAVKAWYDEKDWYDYNTKACQSGKVCGHYTQVVWAESHLMGCAMETCGPLYSSDGSSQLQPTATLFVCNYGPSGNQNEEPFPFYKGAACSNCTNGKGYCRDGLCHNCVSGTCVCALTCKNCGVPNNETCACDCTTGWSGQDCSLPCENANGQCDKGWPNSACSVTPLINYIHRLCPATCKYCEKGTPSSKQCADAGLKFSREAPPNGGGSALNSSIVIAFAMVSVIPLSVMWITWI